MNRRRIASGAPYEPILGISGAVEADSILPETG
jgi:hypothetical protein